MNVAIRDWPNYLQQMLAHLIPGGWVELVEIAYDLASDDGTYCEGTALWEYMDALKTATKKLGIEFPQTDEIAEIAKDTGFEGVEVKSWKVPLGWVCFSFYLPLSLLLSFLLPP